MQELIQTIERPHRKAMLPQVRPGDTVRVHQVIREGSKQRTQVFEGVVLRVTRPNEINARVLVRKITSGVGVEKSWLLHSPNVTKIQVVKRSKVRRAYLTYLRERRGKSARLAELGFDRDAANAADDRTEAQIAEEDEKVKSEADVATTNDAESAENDAADIIEDNTGVKKTDEIESVEVVESTEDLAKEENKAAGADDVDTDDKVGGDDAGDDDRIAGDEFEAGVDRAERKSNNDQ